MKLQKFCQLALACILVVALSIPALATDNGAYSVATNTYYLNPDTGVTDDGGTKNAALGEGMCRSVIYETALIEQDGDKTYLTLRILLMSNIQNFTLEIQGTPGDTNSYYTVTPEIMVEDAGTDSVDMRFEIPYMGCYIRGTAYIIPMVRDVCFYLNTGTALTPYDGNDFIVSVSASPAEVAPEETVEEVEIPTESVEVADEVEPEDGVIDNEVEITDDGEEIVDDVEAEAPTVEKETEERPEEEELTQQAPVEESDEKTNALPMVLGGLLVLSMVVALVVKKRGGKA